MLWPLRKRLRLVHSPPHFAQQMSNSCSPNLLESTVTGPEELACMPKTWICSSPQCTSLKQDAYPCLKRNQSKPVSYFLTASILTQQVSYLIYFEKLFFFKKSFSYLKLSVVLSLSSLSNGLCLRFALEHHTVLQSAIAPGIYRQCQPSRCLPFPEFAPGFS